MTEQEFADEYYVGTQYVIELPIMFYDDHESRDLPSGIELKRNKRFVTIQANRATINEIESDADYYYWTYKEHGFDAGEYRGLAAAAERTMNRIAKFWEQLAEETPDDTQAINTTNNKGDNR